MATWPEFQEGQRARAWSWFAIEARLPRRENRCFWLWGGTEVCCCLSELFFTLPWLSSKHRDLSRKGKFNQILSYIRQMKSYVSPRSECILVMYFLSFSFSKGMLLQMLVSRKYIHTIQCYCNSQSKNDHNESQDITSQGRGTDGGRPCRKLLIN